MFESLAPLAYVILGGSFLLLAVGLYHERRRDFRKRNF